MVAPLSDRVKVQGLGICSTRAEPAHDRVEALDDPATLASPAASTATRWLDSFARIESAPPRDRCHEQAGLRGW
jgi:hypothetical protein